jgi:predicted RNase H-like HicB family nuclease
LRRRKFILGFIEELPGVNACGRSLDETRTMLSNVAQAVFEEERRSADGLLAGKDVIRESFVLPTSHCVKETSTTVPPTVTSA